MAIEKKTRKHKVYLRRSSGVRTVIDENVRNVFIFRLRKISSFLVFMARRVDAFIGLVSAE